MKKKKTTPTKITKKKPYKKLKNKSTTMSYVNKVIIALIFIIITYLVYNIFLSSSKNETPTKTVASKIIEKKVEVKTIPHNNFEEKTKELEVEYIHDVPQASLENKTNKFIFEDKSKEESNKVLVKKEPIVPQKEEKNNLFTEPTVFDDKLENKKMVVEKKPIKEDIKTLVKKPLKEVIKNGKPLLAILIDDVSTKRQVKKILALPYDITMAFLPPTKGHKNSAKINKDIKVHMIHLPLEAGNRRTEEENTLHVGDSMQKMDKRLKNLKKLYPNVKYLNNHTGSKFTASDDSMNKLMQVLKKYDYYFIDSRTSGKTVAKKYAKKYGVPFLSRNIFLDNTQEKAYIQKQLKKAVKIAMKKGSAIAIGHPHSITIKTLRESKHLFKDVQLVYINKLAI